MSEKMPGPYSVSPEERNVRKNVLRDMKEFGRNQAPSPKEDWDLIWVISGSPIDIREDFKDDDKKGEILFNREDKLALADVASRINESRERLETGITIAREVTAKRMNKRSEEVSAADIKNFGPDIYWNGTNWANDNMREVINSGFFEEQYDFPREKIIVSPNLGIENTGHQFERMEDDVVKGRRNVVIVSDSYHLPRIKRYLRKQGRGISEEKVIFYPSEPRRIPIKKALQEIKKVHKYIKEGFFEEER